MPSRPRRAKSPYQRSQSCSKLFFIFLAVNGPRSFDLIRGKGRTVAEVIVGTAVVGQEVHRVVLNNVLGILGHEICTRRKGGRCQRTVVKGRAGVRYHVQWAIATRS